MSTETNDTAAINCTCGPERERGKELARIEGSGSRFFVCKKCGGTIVVLKGEP